VGEFLHVPRARERIDRRARAQPAIYARLSPKTSQSAHLLSARLDSYLLGLLAAEVLLSRDSLLSLRRLIVRVLLVRHLAACLGALGLFAVKPAIRSS
jgi:hypothetical protein